MSFFKMLAGVFPENTIAHKVFDKTDSFMNRTTQAVTGATTRINTGSDVSAADSIKQAGIDIVGAYSRNLENSIKSTSAGISQGATGTVYKSSIIDWLISNWPIVLAAVGLFILLRKKR